MYLAFRRDTFERVAVKVAKYNALEEVIKFKEEVDVAQRIGQIPGAINTAKYSYLVMQIASGGDLFDYVFLHMPLPEMEAKNIFK